tara:strand:- start:39 stop:578 length:540 start_codon:yes stop_codon:yes gene_type:complete
MTVFYTDPLTRVNDKLKLKNGDSNPVTDDVLSPHIPGIKNNDLDYTQQKRSRYQSDFYKYYGLDIVTETVFNYPYPFITEKTLRPIVSKRPFIIVGSSGTLTVLKSKGFQTFSHIIDESYDEILDYSDRFDSVTASIKEFVTQPIEKIRQDVASVIHTLEHNFQNYLVLEDIEISQLNL